MTLENVYHSLKDSGANTIIIHPNMVGGHIDKTSLADTVVSAHKAGLLIFVILPTRSISTVLSEHPEWEDLRYDLDSGKLQPTGKLDLFNPYAIVYVSNIFRDIASYAVDGILLGEDFFYSDTEGMSSHARDKYKQRFGSSLKPLKALERLQHNTDTHQIIEYGEGFWNWAQMKNDVLVLLLKNILASTQSINKNIKIGIPLHVPGFSQVKEQLAWFSYDMSVFKEMDVSLYWIAIPHRDIRAQQNLGYNKSMEVLSRLATSVMTMIHDPAKTIICVQVTSQAGAVLPISEIEEATEMVMHSGEPGLAFMINYDTRLPMSFTKKTFKRR